MKTLIELLPFFRISILGIVTHIIFKLSTLEQETDFSLKKWFSKNTFKTIGSFLAAIGVIFLLDGVNQLTMATALTCGYAADSVIKNAVKSTKDGKLSNLKFK